MKSLLSVPVFTALLLPALATDKVDVVWRREHSSGKTSLKVLDSKTDRQILATCGSTIHANVPIDFTSVDKNGAGYFSVGETNHTVTSRADHSGVKCTRMYSPDVTFVDCVGIDWTNEGVQNDAKDNADDCFDNEASATAFSMLENRNAAVKRGVDVVEGVEARAVEDSEDLEERQMIGGACQNYQDTVLIGDGDPHQNFLLKQLSEPINCASAASCSVGRSDSESFSISANFGIAGSKPFGWITGGFSVSKTWTTGNSYTCNAGTGETVCIWYNTAHTAYTVQVNHIVCQAVQSTDGPYILKSPNNNNVGGGYYCVVGTCRNKGDEYWDDTGRAGGP